MLLLNRDMSSVTGEAGFWTKVLSYSSGVDLAEEHQANQVVTSPPTASTGGGGAMAPENVSFELDYSYYRSLYHQHHQHHPPHPPSPYDVNPYVTTTATGIPYV